MRRTVHTVDRQQPQLERHERHVDGLDGDEDHPVGLESGDQILVTRTVDKKISKGVQIPPRREQGNPNATHRLQLLLDLWHLLALHQAHGRKERRQDGRGEDELVQADLYQPETRKGGR